MVLLCPFFLICEYSSLFRVVCFLDWRNLAISIIFIFQISHLPSSSNGLAVLQKCPSYHSILITISPTAKCGTNVLLTGMVIIRDNAEIGSGSEIHGSTNLFEDVHLIGKVIVNPISVIHKGARINDGSILGRRNYIGPSAFLGQRVITGFHCTINGHVGDNVHLGEGVNIASNAEVLDGLTLEDGVCVEENAVVHENVGARMKVTILGIHDAPPENRRYVLNKGVCEVDTYTG